MIDNDIHLIIDTDTQLIIHTRCVLPLINHTGADDSNHETEIIIRFISLSIIPTGVDDSINPT